MQLSRSDLIISGVTIIIAVIAIIITATNNNSAKAKETTMLLGYLKENFNTVRQKIIDSPDLTKQEKKDSLQELQAIKDSGFKKTPVNLFVNIAVMAWKVASEEATCKNQGYNSCADKKEQDAKKAEECCKRGSQCYLKHHQAHEDACHAKRNSIGSNRQWADYDAWTALCPGKTKAHCRVTYTGVEDHARCPGWECGSGVDEHDTCNGGMYECRLCIGTGKKRWVRVSDGYSGTSCAVPPPKPKPKPRRRGGGGDGS